MKWRSVLPERPHDEPDGEGRLACWRNLANILTDLKRTVMAITPTEGDDDVDDEQDSNARQCQRDLGTDLVDSVNDIRRQLDGIGPVGRDDDLAHYNEEGTDAKEHISHAEAVMRLRALAGGVSHAAQLPPRGAAHRGEPVAGRDRLDADG